MTHPLRRSARLIVLALCAAGLATVALSARQAPAGVTPSFVWKVERGGNVLYLAGSIHALSADVYPLSPAFEHAFSAAGTLVEEIDLSEADPLTLAPLLLGKGMYSDGRRFDTSVSKETVSMVQARMNASGLPFEMFQTMKPWMVMLTLAAVEAQKAGLDPTLGLDKHFFDRAKAAGKTIVGLETAEFQIEQLDKMPEALQEQLLRSTLKEMETEEDSLKNIVSAWKRGDVSSLEKTLLSSFTEYPAAYQSLLVERNRNWLPQIESCLSRPQPCLVVVGAAHLVGPDGLVTALRKKGYRVEQQ